MKLKIKMRAVGVIAKVFFLCLLSAAVGCESTQSGAEWQGQTQKDFNIPAYSGYTAVKVSIMPLSEFVRDSDRQEPTEINVYLSLLDSFDCQVKSPGVFRFELYEKVRQSAEPKGKRITIWPDFDLTEPAENNKYWQDFLRSYKFNLDLEEQIDNDCILQVTCLSPGGRRLSADFELKYTK